MPNGTTRWRLPLPKTVTNEDDLLIELAELLQAIDVDKPIAKLNETTIADNNGRRIYL